MSLPRWVCLLLLPLVPAATAGVVVEFQVESAESPERVGSETFYAQGEMTRMDTPSKSGKGASMIFRDQTMIFVDHAKKSGQKVTKEDVEKMSAELAKMMKQLEGLPPEQRQMMEKMMKGKMPGAEKPPELRVETGGEDRVGSYPCTIYTAYSDEDKVREVCVADESVGSDIFEAMDAFHALAEFSESLMQIARDIPFAQMVDLPFREIDEAGGFPVRTRIFDGEGKVTLERTLKSVTKQEIEPAVFEIPKGYKVKSLDKELRKGR